MKKAYCDFCGKDISEKDELDKGQETYLIPSVYHYEDEDGTTEDLVSISSVEDCCLSCARKFDEFTASLGKE